MGFVIERDAIVYREWAPGAANAQLIGDFNGWDGNAGQMTRDKFGTWEIRIPHGACITIYTMRLCHNIHCFIQVMTASPPSPWQPRQNQALQQRYGVCGHFAYWYTYAPTEGWSVDRLPAWITYATVKPGVMGAKYDGVFWNPPEAEKHRWYVALASRTVTSSMCSMYHASLQHHQASQPTPPPRFPSRV